MYKFRDATLCYIIKDNEWLMLLRNKKTNDINEGKWLGVGGKVELDESPETCIIREIKEETNLNANNVVFRGIIDFIYENKDYEKIWVFTCEDFEGTLKECDEGTLAWINKDNILKLDLWEGDKVFLERLLSGNSELFFYEFKYDEEGKLLYTKDKGELRV